MSYSYEVPPQEQARHPAPPTYGALTKSEKMQAAQPLSIDAFLIGMAVGGVVAVVIGGVVVYLTLPYLTGAGVLRGLLG